MILVLAGTSDARELAQRIQGKGYALLTTVVTDSAAHSMHEAGIPVHVGRLDAEQLVQLAREQAVRVIVDATHPFAEEASRNAMTAAETQQIPYIRFEREQLEQSHHQGIIWADDYKQAAEIAADKGGSIMLTTGGKTLHIFTERLLGQPNITLIARMLPRLDNMQKCEQLGMEQKNIIAMQGPFSKELNAALYRHYNVTLMITKESGKIGAVDEKLEAALEMGIECIIIGRPSIPYGTVYSDFEGVIQDIEARL